MQQNKIGLIGLAVMGANLAKNFASKGVSISVFNRTYSKTLTEVESWNNEREVLIDQAKKNTPWFEKNLENHEYRLEGFENLEAFVKSLERPRKVIIMVKAGQPVDDVITELLSFLEPGDCIIDCGNSNWQDTLRRQTELEAKGYNFIGCGVSGGEQGALKGPSIMPGGKKDAVNEVLPLLEVVSAQDFKGNPCVVNVGTSASGHFVKMVHNGIEYAIMQGIAEIYDILKHNDLSNDDIGKVFESLNKGMNKSFLLDITVEIFKTKDNLADGYLLDKIQNRAGAKGTGKWTVEAAMNLGVFTPSISMAVMARIGSSRNQGFENAQHPENQYIPYPEKDVYDKMLFKAMEGLYLSAYLQGLDLIVKANVEFDWNIDLAQVIRIWQGGCIIRSKMLENLYQKWTQQLNLSNEITGLDFIVSSNLLRPFLVLHASLDYLLTVGCLNLPTNLIQAQRDYFGSHTYGRNDREGVFTGGWTD
ncbi:MAG: NADP-dependent phosphogluconate dehydrogenase [bacterium]